MEKETLEEVAKIIIPFKQDTDYQNTRIDLNHELRKGFIKGAKWQSERMYSEEDMINFHKWAYQKNRIEESDKTTKELLKEWFEQFKKK